MLSIKETPYRPWQERWMELEAKEYENRPNALAGLSFEGYLIARSIINVREEIGVLTEEIRKYMDR